MAKNALTFYRQGLTSNEIQQELDEIVYKHAERKAKATVSFRGVLKRLASMAFIKPFLCIGVINVLCGWVGIDSISSYMIPIFEGVKSSVDPQLAPIIIGAVRVATSGLSSLIFYRASRKVLFVAAVIIT